MNIRDAKKDIINTVKAYLAKDNLGQYLIPRLRQRPILLMGPPGIGKTQIMEQAARECQIGLVSYTITHHTRQSAVGLPFIREKKFEGTSFQVTEYTMSEIICSIYQYMENTGRKEGILFIDEINCVSETLAPTMLQFLQYKTFGNQAVPERPGIPLSITAVSMILTMSPWTESAAWISRRTWTPSKAMPERLASIPLFSAILNFVLRIFTGQRLTWTASSSSLPEAGKTCLR